MPSNPKASLDIPRSRDGSTHSALERRPTSSTFSGSTKGYSIASSEAGESSTIASKRNSIGSTAIENPDAKDEDELNPKRSEDGSGGHKSHRSRGSGAFLLSNSTFEPPADNLLTPDRVPSQRRSPRDHKGKASAVRHQEKNHPKRYSNIGLGIGSSPLAANITSAVGDYTVGSHLGSAETQKENETPSVKATLDADSAQIVNLALNLSESRRNAARRNVSSPLPPLASTFGEGFAGGSLRQHLQQQRRVSRNVSPKPQRASTSSPRVASGQIGSPLNDTFDSRSDGYQYQFTSSTLTRAEKAKKHLELMYHYRRLLQYVPPLNPDGSERPTTPGSSLPNSPVPSRPVSRKTSNTTENKYQIGREYNPLQYIRNRKVRARERKAIDGEAQGFGDREKVSSWVDEVSKMAEESQPAEPLKMPVFSKEAELAASPYTSSRSNPGQGLTVPVKVKRPRIDWEVNPADMLADVFWLEQNGNKTIVEDRFGRKVFPQISEMRTSMPRSNISDPQKTPDSKRALSPDLRIDTKLPEFRSMKFEADRHSDSATSRVRHKIRDATRIHHGHNGSSREVQQFFRARSRSGSDSSDTDGNRRIWRSRSGTADSNDHGRDILEKQMMEMLAKEARQNKTNDLHGERIMQSIEGQTPSSVDEAAKTKTRNSPEGHSRSQSIIADRQKRDSLKHNYSERTSLEVPGNNPRRSLEDLDSTAPNSPQLLAKVSNAFVPSIAMDLSPPTRQNSPPRNPLSKVKSKINPFEHSRARSRGRAETTESLVDIPSGNDERAAEIFETPERRKRSSSPVKKVLSRRTDDSSKSSSKGSIRKGKVSDEASGIRGLFKGSRGPVARVSDFLWRKESPLTGISSGFSTDESDGDESRGPDIKSAKGLGESITPQAEDVHEPSHLKESHSYLNEMPTFTSPFERRGRTTVATSDKTSAGMNDLTQNMGDEQQSTSHNKPFITPPRIDIQNASPASSPDLKPADSGQGSDISDVESRRGSYPDGVQSADTRLDRILGMPGQHRPGFPVTGLYNVEANRGSRQSLEGKRQWSISDRGISTHRGPMTKQEIARVRALLLSSGIKAKEISRRAADIKDLNTTDESAYTEIAKIAPEKVKPVPKSQEHLIAAKILSDDIQLSKQVWQASADVFCNTTVQDLIDKVEILQTKIVNNLIPMARQASDEADEVSKDLVTSQTLKVKHISDTMDTMLRRRRRRFRWIRRGGWVIVEWALVGVMWMVWFMVVFVRVIMGLGRGVASATRWLFWL